MKVDLSKFFAAVDAEKERQAAQEIADDFHEERDADFPLQDFPEEQQAREADAPDAPVTVSQAEADDREAVADEPDAVQCPKISLIYCPYGSTCEATGAYKTCATLQCLGADEPVSPQPEAVLQNSDAGEPDRVRAQYLAELKPFIKSDLSKLSFMRLEYMRARIITGNQNAKILAAAFDREAERTGSTSAAWTALFS